MIFKASRILYNKDAFQDKNGVISFVIQNKNDVTTHIKQCSSIEASAIKEKALELKTQFLIEQEELKIKKQQSQKIQALTINIDGLVFKANDKSISRMRSALSANDDILSLESNGMAGKLGLDDDTDIEALLKTTVWKMADGQLKTITFDQLKIAHAKAILKLGTVLLSNA
jgi:hypothetical protein